MVGQCPGRRLLLLEQDMQAPDIVVARLQLAAQKLVFVAQGRDQGGVVLSCRVLPVAQARPAAGLPYLARHATCRRSL
jgi:hypothetical protein